MSSFILVLIIDGRPPLEGRDLRAEGRARAGVFRGPRARAEGRARFFALGVRGRGLRGGLRRVPKCEQFFALCSLCTNFFSPILRERAKEG